LATGTSAAVGAGNPCFGSASAAARLAAVGGDLRRVRRGPASRPGPQRPELRTSQVGRRYDGPFYASFDLDVFGRNECLEPTEADAFFLRMILSVGRNSPRGERPRAFEKQLGAALPSNRAE